MSRCVNRRRARIAAFLVLLMVLGMLAPLARAANTFADIQYWVGSGSNQAAFVMDWTDGKNPQSLIWGFKWDGAATGETMLKAIVNDDPRLYAHLSTPFSFGVVPYGVGYDLDNDGVFGTTAGVTFDANGLSVNNSTFDASTPTDSDDHWREGWLSDGYWSYWDGGTGTSPTWGFGNSGMSDRVLVNNSWDGWSYAPGFDGPPPSDAVAAQPAPEPATVGALVVVGAMFVCKRRR